MVSHRGGLNISQVVSHRHRGGLISQVVSHRGGLIKPVVSHRHRGGLIKQVVLIDIGVVL